MARKKSLKAFTKEVEEQMTKRVGLGIEELGENLIKDAYDTNETAEELITWYIEKYDLDELTQFIHYS